MLPEALSNDACSLRPGVDRLAVTVELELRGAETVKASFYRSLIRSDERLDYDRVDRIFAGSEDAAGAVGRAARGRARGGGGAAGAAARAAARWPSSPSSRSSPSTAAAHLVEAVASVQTESHRLIEHLMIAANEAVATVLDERSIPTLYRVHERPETQSVLRLVDQLASLDVATPPVPEPLAPSEAAEIVAQCAVLVDQHVRRTGHGRQALTSLVLRSLKQARYSPVNLGHAGLQSPRYCHFTSPIRRYPDLVCHRALLSAVGGGEDAPRAGALDEAAEWTSARERDAMVIERDADDVARCFLLERDMYEGGWDTLYDGEVTGLIGSGAFVTFGANYQGMLPVRRLRGDWWELNEQGTMLLGTRTGGVIRLGDPVRVAVRQVDAPRGRVDLDLVGIPES